MGYDICAPFCKTGQDRLCIGLCIEISPASFQLRTKLFIIIDLAVVDDHIAPVTAVDRLITTVKIDDRQSSVAKGALIIQIEPFAVRSAMRYTVGHLLEHSLFRLIFSCHISCDTAHMRLLLFCIF